jgi:hypothetical protein
MIRVQRDDFDVGGEPSTRCAASNRRRNQPEGDVPGRPPGCRHAPITYVDHAAGHGAELLREIWDIGAERIVSNRQQRFLCRHKRDNRRASA